MLRPIKSKYFVHLSAGRLISEGKRKQINIRGYCIFHEFKRSALNKSTADLNCVP